jgi:hypothetical protein
MRNSLKKIAENFLATDEIRMEIKERHFAEEFFNAWD